MRWHIKCVNIYKWDGLDLFMNLLFSNSKSFSSFKKDTLTPILYTLKSKLKTFDNSQIEILLCKKKDLVTFFTDISKI